MTDATIAHGSVRGPGLVWDLDSSTFTGIENPLDEGDRWYPMLHTPERCGPSPADGETARLPEPNVAVDTKVSFVQGFSIPVNVEEVPGPRRDRGRPLNHEAIVASVIDGLSICQDPCRARGIFVCRGRCCR